MRPSATRVQSLRDGLFFSNRRSITVRDRDHPLFAVVGPSRVPKQTGSRNRRGAGRSLLRYRAAHLRSARGGTPPVNGAHGKSPGPGSECSRRGEGAN